MTIRMIFVNGNSYTRAGLHFGLTTVYYLLRIFKTFRLISFPFCFWHDFSFHEYFGCTFSDADLQIKTSMKISDSKSPFHDSFLEYISFKIDPLIMINIPNDAFW